MSAAFVALPGTTPRPTMACRVAGLSVQLTRLVPGLPVCLSATGAAMAKVATEIAAEAKQKNTNLRTIELDVQDEVSIRAAGGPAPDGQHPHHARDGTGLHRE